jgi:hypothetical protein
MTVRLRALSLGAGVQSTTLALMSARGDLPRVDCAIFSDTGWEPAAVYRHLQWLETQLPFPVHRVSAGNIRDDVISGNSGRSGRFASIPWFLRGPDGKAGMGRRQCTAHYKLEPIARKVRALLGVGPRDYIAPGSVEMWIGISTDEIQRMKPSKRRYLVNRHPLIETDVSRRNCIRWLEERQYRIPPKSARIGCPFHDDNAWRQMRDTAPDEFADAVAADRLIRDGGSHRGIRGQQFMHRSLQPLDQVDFSTWAERGQSDLFNLECEGMCGV